MPNWRRIALPLALAAAPLATLAACDQAKRVVDEVRERALPASGPKALDSVQLADRAMGGRVQPESLMAQTLAPEPLMFVPGEVLVGAKVDAALAQVGAAAGAPSVSRFAADGEPQPVDPALELKAEALAAGEAKQAVQTVLTRMGISGRVDVSAGGMVKIDLMGASPLQGLVAPAAAKPAAVAETDAECPAGITRQALESDLALKTQCVMERLRASDQFTYVEKNYVIGAGFDRIPWSKMQAPRAPGKAAPRAAIGLPNDPLLPFQWDLRARGSGEGQSRGGAGFVPFWLKTRQTGSHAVKIAIIDTGLDLQHPDIVNSPNIAPGIDLISDPARAGDGDSIDPDATDAGDKCAPGDENSYHGTHVAGTIGAAITNDGRGIAGGAWSATIVPVRAIGRCGGELQDIVGAVRWAAGAASASTADGRSIVNANPADIINLSISVRLECPRSLQEAINAAVARGIVVVVAAGNKAAPTHLYAPANCENVLVVAAGDETGGLAYYSNFGPEVSVLAPGGDLFQDTDGDGEPDGVLSTRRTELQCIDPLDGKEVAPCYYSYLQGTSMAAPHVTAALALLKSQFNVGGPALVRLMMQRAIAPVALRMCSIACDQNPNATPIDDQPGQCMRPCGEGALDLGRVGGEP